MVRSAVKGRRRSARTPAIGSGPIAGPGDPIGLTVELFINSAWTDISPYVLYRDSSVMVLATRGRGDETSQPPPQTSSLQINNRDGRFSPRNPTGPYYGQIGRNTPIRVSRLNNGIRRYRFVGEVPSWPTTWDISGSDVWVNITAFGQLRRLAQGTPPTLSAMYRAYAFQESPTLFPVTYWPCEDGANSATIGSGLPGGTAMIVAGSPTFANNTAFVCSKPLPVLNGSIWSGQIPAVAWTDNVLRFLMQIPSGGEADGAVVARFTTTGTVARLDLVYNTGFGGQLKLVGYDLAGNTLFTLGSFTGVSGDKPWNGGNYRFSMALRPSGSQVQYSFQAVSPGHSVGFASGLLASASVGAVAQVVINPNGTLTGTAIGHISVQAVWDTLQDLAGPLNAWLGEDPTARFQRLLLDQGVNGVVNNGAAVYSGETVTMGYQLPDTLLNLVQETATSPLNLLYESRDQLALAMRTRLSLYNQAASLTLDYAQHQLSAPDPPLDDDAFTRNDVTVTRVGGSSVRQSLATGAISTLPPPAGVGDYSTNYPVSLAADSQLPDQAGWRLHMGTVDQPRYTQISVNLRHPTFTSSVDMMNAALTIDIGDRIAIANPPPWMPPDAVTQIVQGYTETMGVFEHGITFNCSPEDPYRIAVADDPVLGRADTDGSTLAPPSGAYGPAATALLVATTGPQPASPLWTTAAGDFPFDVAAGGERMTVTNITGVASPQTFTVTRSVNGVVKTQTAGTDVRLWQPSILSL